MPSTSFTPAGLSGVSIRHAGGFYYVDLHPGTIRTFHYNDATGCHDIPVRVEGPHSFALDRRTTARGACAAAYAHFRFIDRSLAAGHAVLG